MRQMSRIRNIALLSLLPAVLSQAQEDRHQRYSRFSDPGDSSDLLQELPAEAEGIAELAGQLTVHHNLLPYHGISKQQWPQMRRVWPPRLPDLLSALAETGPGTLTGERRVEDRLVGACMMESHMLAGMLRFRDIQARLRAGYFRNMQANAAHVLSFWENTLRVRGINQELLEQNPEQWRREINAFTQTQIDLDKRIEHWVVEYWDPKQSAWRILDANTDFLKATGDLDVGVHLPREYFEYAFEAWQEMRAAEGFNPDRYAEWPQDGRSHIRSQLLWDFYSLLNHDIAGYDKNFWAKDDSATDERQAFAFVKERTYDELSKEELTELDALANLLASQPSPEALITFYRESQTLRLASVEADPYSLAFRN